MKQRCVRLTPGVLSRQWAQRSSSACRGQRCAGQWRGTGHQTRACSNTAQATDQRMAIIPLLPPLLIAAIPNRHEHTTNTIQALAEPGGGARADRGLARWPTEDCILLKTCP